MARISRLNSPMVLDFLRASNLRSLSKPPIHKIKVDSRIYSGTLLSGYKSNKISWLETSAKSDWELSL